MPPQEGQQGSVILEDLRCGDPAAARPHSDWVGRGGIQAGQPQIPAVTDRSQMKHSVTQSVWEGQCCWILQS